jgi:hypothetical protein
MSSGDPTDRPPPPQLPHRARGYALVSARLQGLGLRDFAHARIMVGAPQTAYFPRAEVSHAFAGGRRKVGSEHSRAVVGQRAVLALQRYAGNAAVSALIAARLRSPGDQAVREIDAGLKEIRRDEPALDTVETGLKAANAAGVPVDLEGPKPPP